MAKKKKQFYIVLIGRDTGVFKTWDECKACVEGYGGAKYHGFYKSEELEEYIADNAVLFDGDGKVVSFDACNKSTEYSSNELEHKKNVIYAYVDGSYMEEVNKDVVGSGIVFVKNGEIIDTIIKRTKHSGLVDQRQVGGELIAATLAVKRAIELSELEVHICYDFKGVEDWVTGAWKVDKDNEFGKRYRDEMLKLCGIVKVEFHKIKAHSGNEFNEIADSLAKKAITL